MEQSSGQSGGFRVVPCPLQSIKSKTGQSLTTRNPNPPTVSSCLHHRVQGMTAGTRPMKNQALNSLAISQKQWVVCVTEIAMLQNRPLLKIPKLTTQPPRPPTHGHRSSPSVAFSAGQLPSVSPLPRYQSKITRLCGYQMITKASSPSAPPRSFCCRCCCVVVVALSLLSARRRKRPTTPPKRRDRLFSSINPLKTNTKKTTFLPPFLKPLPPFRD